MPDEFDDWRSDYDERRAEEQADREDWRQDWLDLHGDPGDPPLSTINQHREEREMLNEFEGQDVLQSTIKITRAGDGLSQALQVEPVEYHNGETVHVVLACVVDGITIKPIPNTEVSRRVHTLVTQSGTIVAADLVADVLEEQRRKIAAAKGVHELPFIEDLDPDLDEPEEE